MKSIYALLTGAFIFYGQTAFAAEPSPAQMVLKEDTPATGTNIKRNLAYSTQLPLNRKYQELTEKEKAAFHAMYENIAPGDEPPFPLDGLKPIVELMSRLQNKLRVSGNLNLLVSVDEKGVASEVTAIGSPDPQMTKFASLVLLETKYKPALCAGKPCKMQFPFYLEFELN